MIDQPDTTAIRAYVRMLRDPDPVIGVLCTSLDAARGERDDMERAATAQSQYSAQEHARAEAAEAQVREDVLALDEANAMLRTALARAEAAEAQRDAACAKEFHHRELIGHLRGRAEGAEARIAAALAWFARTVREDVLALDEANAMLRTALARAEAAEARIAAALAWFARTDCTWTYRVEMAHRALTEGTGQ